MKSLEEACVMLKEIVIQYRCEAELTSYPDGRVMIRIGRNTLTPEAETEIKTTAERRGFRIDTRLCWLELRG